MRARVHDVRPLLDALHRAGLDPSWDWERVDSALALEAALERGPWDVVVHSTTPGLTPEQVAALVGTRAPIVTVTRIDQLAASVRGVLPAD